VRAFAAGNASSFNYTAAVIAANAAAATAAPYTPSSQETEDCLFLDVVVPTKIFNNANNLRKRQAGTGAAPVLVWYGGTLFYSLDTTYFPAGSMAAVIQQVANSRAARTILPVLSTRLTPTVAKELCM